MFVFQDLEIAADFEVERSTAEVFERLHATGHAQVTVPHNPGYLIFAPQLLCDDRACVVRLLNISCGRDDGESVACNKEG